MSTTRYLFGLLLFIIGVLLLLSNFNYLNVNWAFIIQFWPVLLILLGIGAVTKNRPVRLLLVTLTVLLTVALAMYGIQKGWLNPNVKYKVEEQDLAIEYAEEEQAVLNLETGAGKFSLSGASDSLIEAQAKTSLGLYTMQRSGVGGGEVDLRLDGQNVRWSHVGSVTNNLNISLHDQPVWQINVKTGATSLNFDLTKHQVEKIEIDTGASEVKVKIGNLTNQVRVKISAGASKIHLLLPEEFAARLDVDSGLSSHNFPQFTEVSKGVYETENFSTANKTVTIEIDAGLSDLQVSRY